jgi:hypothetical protein
MDPRLLGKVPCDSLRLQIVQFATSDVRRGHELPAAFRLQPDP